MTNKILLLKGDGIGPEVMQVGESILRFLNKECNLNIEIEHAMLGGEAIDHFSTPYPEETRKLAKESSAILLAAVGGPKWDNMPSELRPEQGLLGIRSDLNLFANLRPIKTFNSLLDASSLKKELISDLDIMIVRELTGGIYFGEQAEKEINGERAAYSVDLYTESEIRRITEVAINISKKRTGKICSVDKANVLKVSQFWREIVIAETEAHQDIELTHQYVDNAAMQLIKDPKQFDVILTNNMFGDILSDEAAMLTGSIGMLPSASLNEYNKGMFEPCHGSAPDIAGQDKANPLALVLSIAMMMRYSLHFPDIADILENSVEEILISSIYTDDIAPCNAVSVGTTQMGKILLESLMRVV